MLGVAQIADLALLVIDFLKRIEEMIDPEEKSTIEDKILDIMEQVAKKLASPS